MTMRKVLVSFSDKCVLSFQKLKLHKLILFFEYLTGQVPVLENQCRFRLYEIGGEIHFYKKKYIS